MMTREGFDFKWTCGTEAALHLSSERDQMAAASGSSHLPHYYCAMIGMHEKSLGCHDVPEKPGPQEADTNVSTTRNDIIVSVWA